MQLGLLSSLRLGECYNVWTLMNFSPLGWHIERPHNPASVLILSDRALWGALDAFLIIDEIPDRKNLRQGKLTVAPGLGDLRLQSLALLILGPQWGRTSWRQECMEKEGAYPRQTGSRERDYRKGTGKIWPSRTCSQWLQVGLTSWSF
jgi:hypothetical protein